MTHFIRITSLGLLLTLALYSTSHAQNNWDSMVDSAFTNFNKGKYEQSLYWFDRLIYLSPDQASLYEYKAKAEFLTNRWEPALKTIGKAIELDSTNYVYYWLKGTVYATMMNNRDALKSIRKAYALKSNDINLNGHLASIELTQSNYKNAYYLFDNLLNNQDYPVDLRERIIITHNFVSNVLHKEPKYTSELEALIEKYLNDYNSSIDIEQKIKHIEEITFFYFSGPEPTKARPYIEEGLKLDSGNFELSIKLGYCFMYEAKYDSAYQLYKVLAKEKPSDLTALTNLIYTAAKTSHEKLALEKIDELLRLYPKYTNAFGNRGLAYLKLKNFELAEENFNKALEITPNSPWVYRWLGRLYIEHKNDKQKACECFKKAQDLGYREVHHLYDLENEIKTNCTK